MALALPPVTVTDAGDPALSMVNVVAVPAITNEFAFVINNPPTASLVSNVTVRSAELAPSVAESPGACGTRFGVQFAAVLQLPSAFAVHVATTEVKSTEIVTVRNPSATPNEYSV